MGRAAVPSGASTGTREAVELRDGDKKRYLGKGVLQGRRATRTAKSARRCSATTSLDQARHRRDDDRARRHRHQVAARRERAARRLARRRRTRRREPRGRRCSAVSAAAGRKVMPVPMMNIINGGAHADNSVDIQEFMILPVGAPSFSEALRYGAEIFHTLKKVLHERGLATAVGDEGGFAPNLPSNEAALETILRGGRARRLQAGPGHLPRSRRGAASEFYQGRQLRPRVRRPQLHVRRSSSTISPDSSTDTRSSRIEDGMAEGDWDGWTLLTQRLGKQDPARRRRPVRHQHEDPARGHRARHRQLDPDQAEPDRHADRDARGDRHGARRPATRRSSRIARARPRTARSPTSPSPHAPRRSRPARSAAPTASPSTTSCCASRPNSAVDATTPAGMRSRCRCGASGA